MTDGPGPEPAVAGAGPSSPFPLQATGLDAAPGPDPGQRAAKRDDGRPGHQVVLGLFVVLAVCVLIVFTVFALVVRPEDREWIPEMTARYLYMPVVATSILVAIDAWRAGAARWWVFLVTAPVPLLNVGLAAAWILKWRHAPSAWLTATTAPKA